MYLAAQSGRKRGPSNESTELNIEGKRDFVVRQLGIGVIRACVRCACVTRCLRLRACICALWMWCGCNTHVFFVRITTQTQRYNTPHTQTQNESTTTT